MVLTTIAKHNYEQYHSRLKELTIFNKIFYNGQSKPKDLAEAYVYWYNHVEEDIISYFKILNLPISLSDQDRSVAVVEALQLRASPFYNYFGRTGIVPLLHAARKFRVIWSKDPIISQAALPHRSKVAWQVQNVNRAMREFVKSLIPNESDSYTALEKVVNGNSDQGATTREISEKEARLQEWEARLERREKAIIEEESRIQQGRYSQEKKAITEELPENERKTQEDLIDLSEETDFKQNPAAHNWVLSQGFAGTEEQMKPTYEEKAGYLDMSQQSERLRRLEEENARLREGFEVIIKASSQIPLFARHGELGHMMKTHQHQHGRHGQEGTEASDLNKDVD
ncbi:MAG: hypothetical protein Q9163_001931 [Psora crenata]